MDSETVYTNITYYDTYVIKKAFAKWAAAWEVFGMEKAREKYKYIPEVYSINSEFITMERVYGKTILAYFKEKKNHNNYKLIMDQFENVVKQIVYEAEINYMDWHSGNTLIDENDNVWIIDFDTIELIDSTEDKQVLFEEQVNQFIYDINKSLKKNGLGYIIKPR